MRRSTRGETRALSRLRPYDVSLVALRSHSMVAQSTDWARATVGHSDEQTVRSGCLVPSRESRIVTARLLQRRSWVRQSEHPILGSVIVASGSTRPAKRGVACRRISASRSSRELSAAA